jgi:Bacterial transcriptional activator domain/Transcriptional regulatory protein, C terminal
MEFRILGPLEVWDEGGLVSLGGRKPRALLAVLLLHPNEVVSADRMIDELWGEDSPERAHATLRVNVSRLRMALPQGVLATRSPGYAIRVAPDEFDLHRFERLVDEGRSFVARGLAADASERLRDALSLWRGPALSDFANGRFAQAAIARLEEIRLAAVELRIDADLVLGRHHKLVGGGGLASHGPMTRRAEQAAAHHTGSVLRSDRRLEVDGFVAGRPSYRSAPDAGRPASGGEVAAGRRDRAPRSDGAALRSSVRRTRWADRQGRAPDAYLRKVRQALQPAGSYRK